MRLPRWMKMDPSVERQVWLVVVVAVARGNTAAAAVGNTTVPVTAAASWADPAP